MSNKNDVLSLFEKKFVEDGQPMGWVRGEVSDLDRRALPSGDVVQTFRVNYVSNTKDKDTGLFKKYWQTVKHWGTESIDNGDIIIVSGYFKVDTYEIKKGPRAGQTGVSTHLTTSHFFRVVKKVEKASQEVTEEVEF